jgi:hypothetical protein
MMMMMMMMDPPHGVEWNEQWHKVTAAETKNGETSRN